jgi:hypothetical protein
LGGEELQIASQELTLATPDGLRFDSVETEPESMTEDAIHSERVLFVSESLS